MDLSGSHNDTVKRMSLKSNVLCITLLSRFCLIDFVFGLVSIGVWFRDFFLLDILCIYISNVIPFPSFPSGTPSPYFYECAPSPTHSFPPRCPGILLHWGIKPSQDQGPLLLLMPHNAILCNICSWSHELLHVYALVGALVSGSSGGGV